MFKSSQYVAEFYHVVSIARADGEKQCKYSGCVSLYVCVCVSGCELLCKVLRCVQPQVCAEWTRCLCMLLDFEQVDKGLDSKIVKSMASSTVVCQFLCIVATNDLPIPGKGVIMRRMLDSRCGVHLDSKLVWVQRKTFLIFLMIRYNGYA